MTRRTTLLAALAIIVAVAAAYSNSFSGPFIFDDVGAIRDNATIRSLRSFQALIPPGTVTVSRRPLTNLSFAINYAIGRARRPLVPRGEPADPSARRADALRHRPPHAAAAGAARSVRRRLDRPGGGRGADLGAPSAVRPNR